jgi:hypothetical protein
VTAAADQTLSSKARRKRKQQQQQQGTGGSSSSSKLPVAVAWMNPKMQQRAFGDAWLSFLRMGLPDDIYKKVTGHCRALCNSCVTFIHHLCAGYN